MKVPDDYVICLREWQRTDGDRPVVPIRLTNDQAEDEDEPLTMAGWQGSNRYDECFEFLSRHEPEPHNATESERDERRRRLMWLAKCLLESELEEGSEFRRLVAQMGGDGKSAFQKREAAREVVRLRKQRAKGSEG